MSQTSKRMVTRPKGKRLRLRSGPGPARQLFQAGLAAWRRSRASPIRGAAPKALGVQADLAQMTRRAAVAGISQACQSRSRPVKSPHFPTRQVMARRASDWSSATSEHKSVPR